MGHVILPVLNVCVAWQVGENKRDRLAGRHKQKLEQETTCVACNVECAASGSIDKNANAYPKAKGTCHNP